MVGFSQAHAYARISFNHLAISILQKFTYKSIYFLSPQCFLKSTFAQFQCNQFAIEIINIFLGNQVRNFTYTTICYFWKWTVTELCWWVSSCYIYFSNSFSSCSSVQTRATVKRKLNEENIL